jgi:hypothetical protein
MIIYRYTMQRTAADDQSWETETLVVSPADFGSIADLALRDTFQKLTNGKAVFGSPGVGCKGPYTITKLVVEKIADEPG